jgi:virginiamycin A acetyltransferase
MIGPDPRARTPLSGHPRVKFPRPLADGRPNVTVGDFAYYDDPEDRGAFFDENVLHHYEFVGDRLTIGPFVAVAAGVRVMMNGGAHATGGFSTFPFNIFGGGWERGFDPATWDAETRGDTITGPDVWIGTEAMILPGVRIGPGAIVAARSVVSRDVEPYTVVAGNPAQPVRRRFDAETIAALLEIAWWDWPAERLAAGLDAVRGADLGALRRAAAA